MASTNFSSGTVIASTWLNDVNVAVYTTIPSHTSSISTLTTNVGTNTGNISTLQGQMTTVQGVASGAQTTANNAQTTANAAQVASAKDASGGYAGLTGYTINFKNTSGATAGSVISYLLSNATAARTYTFPDKSGTVAMTSDIPAVTQPGLILLATTNISNFTGNVDYLSLFTANPYKTYIIEFCNLTVNTGGALVIPFSTNGTTVDGTITYYNPLSSGSTFSGTSANGIPATPATSIPVTGSSFVANITLKLLNMTTTTAGNDKGYTVSGHVGNLVVNGVGKISSTAVLSGFRATTDAGNTFAGGTIKVYAET